jgi:two-component system response regulator AtoC
MQQLRDRFEPIARSSFPVLITGESGTGKEVFARLLHQMSRAPESPFVKVNCPAIPSGLLETELFGYEKGAFTDATTTKRGRIELANGGVLFLDEIADLDRALQSKLLQVLQDGTFSRLGAQEDRQVNVRVVSATNRDLRAQVQAGIFREDIFHRMNAFHLHLVPLRSRIADLPVLIEYFLAVQGRQLGRSVPLPSRELLSLMRRYAWPGNIRELENLIRRYAIFASEDSIVSELAGGGLSSLLSAEVYFDPEMSLKQISKRAILDLERQIILQVLQRNQWNRKRTAKMLGISYRSLFYKMRDSGLNVPSAVETLHVAADEETQSLACAAAAGPT